MTLTSAAPTNFAPPAVVGVYSQWSVGIEEFLGSSAVSGATVFPVANTALFYPLYVPVAVTVARLWVVNGGATSGNLDLGIYRADSTSTASLMVSKGSTAQSASTNVVQFLDVTDTFLAPGDYYFAVALDNTTGKFNAGIPNALRCQAMGCAQMASAFPLPSTATLALNANPYVVNMGFTTRSGL